MQNVSVFASSIAQLKLPQNRTPPIAPTITSVATEKRPVGLNSTPKVRAISPRRAGSVMVSPWRPNRAYVRSAWKSKAWCRRSPSRGIGDFSHDAVHHVENENERGEEQKRLCRVERPVGNRGGAQHRRKEKANDAHDSQQHRDFGHQHHSHRRLSFVLRHPMRLCSRFVNQSRQFTSLSLVARTNLTYIKNDF